MKKLYKPLSDKDLEFFYKKANIKRYSELTDKMIRNMKNNSHIIIHIPTESNSIGHWQLLTKYNNKYHFFCSYGSKPDELLRYKEFNLKPLLKKYNCTHNKYLFQNDKDLDISTCGRHVIFRILMFDEFNVKSHKKYKEVLDQFLKVMDNIPTYDHLVTTWINKDLMYK
jgi:hypothetical protein